MLLEHLPYETHPVIKGFDSQKMGKIAELMRIRIHFFKDMVNHTYFFIDPTYSTEISQKFLSKLNQ